MLSNSSPNELQSGSSHLEYGIEDFLINFILIVAELNQIPTTLAECYMAAQEYINDNGVAEVINMYGHIDSSHIASVKKYLVNFPYYGKRLSN